MSRKTWKFFDKNFEKSRSPTHFKSRTFVKEVYDFNNYVKRQYFITFLTHFGAKLKICYMMFCLFYLEILCIFNSFSFVLLIYLLYSLVTTSHAFFSLTLECLQTIFLFSAKLSNVWSLDLEI